MFNTYMSICACFSPASICMGIKRLLYRFDLRITGASIRTMFVQFGAHIFIRPPPNGPKLGDSTANLDGARPYRTERAIEEKTEWSGRWEWVRCLDFEIK